MEVTMKLARRVLPLMLLVLAFALPSQAQTGEIIGEVIGFDGAPLAGATMVVTRQDIDQEFQVDTGADGTYRTRVPIGRYRVTDDLSRSWMESMLLPTQKKRPISTCRSWRTRQRRAQPWRPMRGLRRPRRRLS